MEACKRILSQITAEGAYENDQMFDMNIWDWSQGVALYGIWKYYLAAKEEKYLIWLEQWFSRQFERFPQEETINTMAPYLTLACLYEYTGKKEYGIYCELAAQWLTKELPRTEMYGFQHVTIDSQNEQQLWADTVFMAVLFLAKHGELTKRKEYIDEAKRQFLLHITYLSEPETGLWCHGWSFKRRDHFAGAHWARGNCWFTIAVAEAVEFLPEDDWVTQWILGAYKKQTEALLKLQDESGLWHTLLDHKDSYLEVSGSCGILYGLLKGMRLRLLSDTCKEAVYKGVNAAFSYIREDGIVEQVSYGTILADTLDYYKNVSISPTGYGQNLMLMLLVEAMHHQDKKMDI